MVLTNASKLILEHAGYGTDYRMNSWRTCIAMSCGKGCGFPKTSRSREDVLDAIVTALSFDTFVTLQNAKLLLHFSALERSFAIAFFTWSLLPSSSFSKCVMCEECGKRFPGNVKSSWPSALDCWACQIHSEAVLLLHVTFCSVLMRNICSLLLKVPFHTKYCLSSLAKSTTSKSSRLRKERSDRSFQTLQWRHWRTVRSWSQMRLPLHCRGHSHHGKFNGGSWQHQTNRALLFHDRKKQRDFSAL